MHSQEMATHVGRAIALDLVGSLDDQSMGKNWQEILVSTSSTSSVFSTVSGSRKICVTDDFWLVSDCAGRADFFMLKLGCKVSSGNLT